MNIITLYESASSNGYNSVGDGRYFTSESDARLSATNKYKGHAAEPLRHKALNVGDEYYLLKKEKPITIVNCEKEREHLKAAALSKLSKEERELLGLETK